MVGPSPLSRGNEAELNDKPSLRAKLAQRRREHVSALPQATTALLFLRPPAPVAALAPEGATVGFYHSIGHEAPTRSYARWFFENGRTIALPWFAGRGAPMEFRVWTDPFDDTDLEVGPYGALQPGGKALEVVPDLAFIPLLGFTAAGDRLGRGGGHYDRWLAAHPGTIAVGLGWDCQLLPALPSESHDHTLRAIVTPTRYYEAGSH